MLLLVRVRDSQVYLVFKRFKQKQASSETAYF